MFNDQIIKKHSNLSYSSTTNNFSISIGNPIYSSNTRQQFILPFYTGTSIHLRIPISQTANI